MKNRILLIFFLCVLCVGLSAQSTAAEIETLLATDAVTYAQASRFVLEASDKMITQNPQEAFQFAAENNWLPVKSSADQTARLDDISLLVMNAFDVKGGLFYSLFGNSHYAYREMVYRKHIQGRADPAMDVSGELLLFMVGRLVGEREKTGQDYALAPPPREPLIPEISVNDDAIRRQDSLTSGIIDEEEILRQQALAAEAAARDEAARREAELAAAEAAAREEAARREAELAAADVAAREEAARRQAELAATDAATREETARREAELAAADAAARDEAARRQAELAAADAAARDEVARRQTELAAADAAARDEAMRREAAERVAREEAARRQAELAAADAAARDEAIRREAAERAAREEAARREASIAAGDSRFPVILFDADITTLDNSGKAKLQEAAGILRDIPGVKVVISGHAALAGSEAGRNSISSGRARNVANYLISLGAVNAADVTIVSYGGRRPIASNATPEGMAANRRVEITILED